MKKNNWAQKNKKLTKKFEFNNFKQALEFVNKVGELAESADHHPDILLHDYKFVTITLTTHSEGKITKKDMRLSSQIDKITPKS